MVRVEEADDAVLVVVFEELGDVVCDDEVGDTVLELWPEEVVETLFVVEDTEDDDGEVD